jgi:hypothetical protein
MLEMMPKVPCRMFIKLCGCLRGGGLEDDPAMSAAAEIGGSAAFVRQTHPPVQSEYSAFPDPAPFHYKADI